MNPDDDDFWNDEDRHEDEPQDGPDEEPGVPEDFDPDWGGDDGKVDDPFDLDNCCRSGCRGCEKAPPLAKPDPGPDLGNEPPF